MLLILFTSCNKCTSPTADVNNREDWRWALYFLVRKLSSLYWNCSFTTHTSSRLWTTLWGKLQKWGMHPCDFFFRFWANPEQRQRACRPWGHNSTSGLVPMLLKPIWLLPQASHLRPQTSNDLVKAIPEAPWAPDHFPMRIWTQEGLLF